MIHKTMTVLACALTVAAAASAAPNDLTPAEAKAREIYETVIAMRTAKGHGKVPEMAAYLAGELKGAGFADEDIEIFPSGETAAMAVRYRGDGSSGAKPILFLAHMDVVDAKREDWEHDPFTLREEDGYFIGRGVADNKYGVVNLTQTFMRLKQEGFTPTRDLVLVFTGDEETEMTTTRMMAYDKKDWTDAEFALNSDGGGGAYDADGTLLPYFMQAAEKTYATFEVTAVNPGGHSSRPRADNAIYDLAEALSKIRAHQFPVMANEITRASARAVGAMTGGDVTSSFWVTQAGNLVRGALFLLHHYTEHYNLAGLQKFLFIITFRQDIGQRIADESWSANEPASMTGYEDSLIMFEDSPEKTQANFKTTAASALSRFTHPDLVKSFCKSDEALPLEQVSDGTVFVVDIR